MSDSFYDILHADTAFVLSDLIGGGEDIIIHLMGDAAQGVTLRGCYGAAGVDVAPSGATAPVISVAPMLHMQAADIAAALGRPLDPRDRVIVRGKRWRIQSPQDDGFGLLACKLLEAPEVDPYVG